MTAPPPPVRVRVSLSQQIEEIAYQLGQERRGSQASADARMHVLRLEAVIETLKLIRDFEADVREVVRHGLDRRAEGAQARDRAEGAQTTPQAREATPVPGGA